MHLRMCAATRSTPGVSAAGPTDPQIGRASSSVSDDLPDPIPETLSEQLSVDARAQGAGPLGTDHRNAIGPEGQTSSPRCQSETSNQNLSPEAQLVQGLLRGVPRKEARGAAAGEVDAGVPRLGISLTSNSGVRYEVQDAHRDAQATRASSFRVPEVKEPPQWSQSRVGTVSDTSSRGHHSSGFAATANVDSEAGFTPSRQVLSAPFHAGYGRDGGGAIHEPSGVGRGEQPSRGLSMLAQMFGSRALGVGCVDGNACRGLSVADCVGPDEHVPGHSTRQGDGSDGISSVTTSGQGLRLQCLANSDGHVVDGGSGQPAREAEVEHMQEALAVRAPGHDPPVGVQGNGEVEPVAEIMQPPGSPDSSEGGVAPLAAQLAQLYC